MNSHEGQSESNDFPESIAPLEVEQKYRVESHEAVLKCLQAMKARELPLETQCDIYLKHPCRDFATTGEAFRIRQVNDSAVVTYKGARLPGVVKTRVETEIALADKTEREWLQILLALGFCEAARVRKRRRSFTISFQTATFTVALDTVESLGSFIEIEAIVTDRRSLAKIQENILDLAKKLQVDQIEPRSYLRQLLEQLQLNS